MKNIKYIVGFFTFITIIPVAAQSDGTTINVNTGFEPKLSEVDKLYEQPVINDTVPTSKTFSYLINSNEVKTKYELDTISAVKLKNEPLQKLQRFFLKFGFGNYLTPFVDVSLNSLRHKTDAYSFRYRHLSSRGIIKNVGDPWMANHEGYADYKHMFKKNTIRLAAEYHNNQIHYYGYDPDLFVGINRDSTFKSYNTFNGTIDFYSKSKNDSVGFNYKASADFYHIFDNYKSNETKVTARLDVNKFTNKFLNEFFGGQFDFTYLGTKNDSMIETFHGYFVNMMPYIKAGGKNWNLFAGVKLSIYSDTSSVVNVYPDIRFNWNIFKQFVIFNAEVGGEYRRASYQNMMRENPFIMPVVEMKNTNEYIRLKGGLKGQFFSNMGYNVGVQYSYFGNLHYFINDTTDAVRRGFDMIYDNTNYVNIFAELNYKLGEKLQIGVKGNYHIYDPLTLTTPYHKPNFDVAGTVLYNMGNKLIFSFDTYLRGPQKALTYVLDPITGLKKMQDVNLNMQVDINLGAEYRINKNVTLWINFNNIAAWRYNRFYNYPTQQFNLLGGFTLSL